MAVSNGNGGVGAGAIFASNTVTNIYFLACSFINNHANGVNGVGGGIVLNFGISNVYFFGNKFVGNSAYQGGAVAKISLSSTIYFFDTIFTSNIAMYGGGR